MDLYKGFRGFYFRGLSSSPTYQTDGHAAAHKAQHIRLISKSYISMSPGHPLGTGAGLRPAIGPGYLWTANRLNSTLLTVYYLYFVLNYLIIYSKGDTPPPQSKYRDLQSIYVKLFSTTMVLQQLYIVPSQSSVPSCSACMQYTSSNLVHAVPEHSTELE